MERSQSPKQARKRMLEHAKLGGQVSQDGTVVFFYKLSLPAERGGGGNLLNNMRLVQLRRANI